MVKLADVRQSNASLRSSPTNLVAVFTGGTAGIGESSLRALAKNAKAPIAYIVGRNEARAALIIEECLRDCPEGRFEFIQADLSLLKNVDAVCEEIARREGRLDLLFMSQGYLTFEGRRETSEGLDALLALRYYGRMRLIWKLLPLLEKSDAASVVSVFAPGNEGKLYVDDLGLRDPAHFGVFSHISHSSYMTTFFMEEIARRAPAVSLVHVYPGLVKTDEFQKGLFPWWFKLFTRWVLLPLVTPFAVAVPECGERNLFHATSARYPPARMPGSGAAGRATMMELPARVDVAGGSDGARGSGCYSVGWDGRAIRNEKLYGKVRKEGVGQLVWEHTMRAFEEIEAGRVFKD